jgi:hypothetical protein
MLLVELHYLLVEGFLVACVLLLENLHPGLEFLHLLHADQLLVLKRVKHDPDENGKDNDRYAVRMCKRIQTVKNKKQEISRRFPKCTQRIHLPLGEYSLFSEKPEKNRGNSSGTGSNPPLFQGPHFIIRKKERTKPLENPNREMLSMA